MKKPQPQKNYLSQRGAALVTGLVFLVILTLLGLSSSRGVIMQELIARNFRDEDLALQAAEAALKAAENCIRLTNGRPTGLNSVTSNCIVAGTSVPNTPYTETAIANTDSTFWTTNGTPFDQAAGETLTLPSGALAQQPRYIVAVLDREQCSPCQPQFAYQVTAWGTGINANTQKVVQSIFLR